jgi:hypothetical protein
MTKRSGRKDGLFTVIDLDFKVLPEIMGARDEKRRRAIAPARGVFHGCGVRAG